MQPEPVSAGPPPGAPAVLIVEDDRLMLDALCSLLRRAGCRAEGIDNAAQALERISAGGVDLLLLDLLLPGMDGFELCRRVRALPMPVYLPIIMLTGLVNDESRHAGFAAGADDYVTKPFSRDELLDRIHVWLRARERFAQASRGQRWLAAVVDSSCHAIVGGRPDGTITSWNSAAERLYDCPTDDALGRSLIDFAPNGARDDLADLLARVRQGERVAHFETLQRRHDGQLVEAVLAIAPVSEPDGQVVGVSTVVREVGERRRAEALQHLQSEITRRMNEGVCLVRAEDHQIVYANPRLEQMFGYAAGELIGQLASTLNAPVDGRTPEELARAIRDRLETHGETDFEVLNRRKDGSTFWSRGRASRFEHAEYGTVWLSVQQDVTEQRQLEQALQQAQRLETVSQLAGGIAHEFNNQLTIIIGFAELLQLQFAPNDPRRESIEEIAQAGARAETITQQLLAFSRRQMLQPRVVDLNTVVQPVTTMLRPLIGEQISLRAALDPTLPPVRVDPGQMEQVLLSLAVNAREAMPGGGTLTISTGTVDLDAKAAEQYADLRPGRYVELTVSDTGVGLDEATRARIFEPFFSTKPDGKGRGLGLAMVYGIVKQSEGSITVSSRRGAGTTFRILLPPAEPERVVSPPPAASPAAASGQETVLLVEDEPGVRSLAATILRGQGYQVLSAEHAAAALRLLESFEDPIDVLVTDVVMPGMNGQQLAERLTVDRPGLKVVYMSGYTEDAVVDHGAVDPGKQFLHKPFTPQALARAVREVLGAK